MTTETTVFTTETPPVVPPVATTQVPQELQDLVGTGKKYATIEEALKSVPHAQTHISKIEQELAQVKEELSKRKTTEELLEELKNSGLQNTDTSVKPAITPEQINKIVSDTLLQNEHKKVVASNVATVIQTFKEKFGDKAEEVFINIAKESGLTITDLNNLAGASPSAVLKLAGIDKQITTVPNKLKSDINTESLKPNNTSTTNAKVSGTGTKDLVDAWKRAGVIVGKT